MPAVAVAVSGGGGTSDHALLSHLAYADAAHTGFAGTAVANGFTRQQAITPSIADVTLGDEILLDTTFPDLTNWNDDSSGWNALNPGLTHTPGVSGELFQAVSLTTPGVFVLTIVVSGMTTGWVDVYDDYDIDIYTETNGTFSNLKLRLDYQSSDTIWIDVSSDFDGTIESVSFKPSTIGFPPLLVLKDLDGNVVAHVRTQGSGLFIGHTAGTLSINGGTGYGDHALNGVTDQIGNIGIGPYAGAGTTGANTIHIGSHAGENSTGSRGVYIGPSAGKDETIDAQLHLAGFVGVDLLSGTMDSVVANQVFQVHAPTVILADLPTSSTGLPTGALWNDSGAVKIA